MTSGTLCHVRYHSCPARNLWRTVVGAATTPGARRRSAALPATVVNTLTHNSGVDYDAAVPFVCRPQGCPCGYLTDPRK